MSYRPNVAVDLDRVLAEYDQWKGAAHIGDPIPNAREFLAALHDTYTVILWSTRLNDKVGDKGMKQDQLASIVWEWLEKHEMATYVDKLSLGCKPIAIAFVDDRAVHCDPKTNASAFADALVKIDQLRDRSRDERDAAAQMKLALDQPTTMTLLQDPASKPQRGGRKSQWSDLTLQKIDQYLVNEEHSMKEIAALVGVPYNVVTHRRSKMRKGLVKDPDTGIMVHPSVVGARSGDL